ncbi:hypothetical protein DACRYDRAFT_44276 [Dacryopinax primogenitus]|uniref:DnaJ homologue subfamily C member 28 conserved domain-containing protein n=1 Tax=Dacryopinax primogenitus (strain DJM 731) TaxID=1858805 RepID=M5GFY1_DACPD|nr:uncharacterized protein DACRYDRAFT_44276 [Dacryopinax primogenitus]EJU06672.1 hypothetical protein DACRYDRAFT_44276 [Dacryopinax primogenitus]
MSWRHTVSTPRARSWANLATRRAHSSSSTVTEQSRAEDSPTASTSASTVSPYTAGSASAKLFSDALTEEQRPPSARIQQLLNKEENWTGDERIEDTVLRMLVDKYKPLRGGTVRTAEEKIRQRKEEVIRPSIGLKHEEKEEIGQRIVIAPVSTSKPVVDPATHRPWHTTFRAPSHSTTSQVKYGNPIRSSPSNSKTPQLPADTLADPRLRAAAKLARKRVEHAGRIVGARERTLDYRLGTRGTGGRAENPTSMRGWTSLVEDMIEQARLAGQFDELSGRGMPIVRELEESNPFLGREEFFMNRIVKRNGAAPPWIEVQKEVEDALNTFRRIIQESWVRRATRMLTHSQPPNTLRHMSLLAASRYRDAEWERRELGYHTTAIEEINGLIRKYNAMAPYAVRRTYVTREAELQRIFEQSGDEIVKAFRNVYGPTLSGHSATGVADEEESKGMGPGLGRADPSGRMVGFSLRVLIARLITKLSM